MPALDLLPRLSPADRELAERDVALPGLATLLCPEAFRGAAMALAPHEPIGAIQPLYLKYKPGLNCLAGFDVEIAGRIEHVHAMALRREESERVHRIATRAAAPRTGPGRETAILDRFMTLASFPIDRKLKALKRLADDGRRPRLLHEILPTRPDLAACTLRTLTYKPHRRFVGALIRDHGPAAAVRLYSQAPASHNSLASTGTLVVPRCLASSLDPPLAIVEWLPGIRVEPDLDGTACADAFGRIGEALALLHGQQAIGLTPREPQWPHLDEMARGVGFIIPELARRAERLAVLLTEGLRARRTVLRPIHGDFHVRQVLLDEKSTVILDLDEACIGEPAADLGSLLAHWRFYRMMKNKEDNFDELLIELLKGYGSAGMAVTPEIIRLHAAIALYRRSMQPFRERMPDWPQKVDKLFRLCEEEGRCCLSEGSVAKTRANSKIDVQVPWNVLHEPTMRFARRALRRKLAARRLAECLAERHRGAANVMLRAIRVVRHRPRFRCLIEYDLDVKSIDGPIRRETLIGKVQARGGDEPTYRLARDLWHSGFDGRGSRPFGVPEPLGLLPDLRLWLQAKVAGRSSFHFLPSPGGPSLARRIAEALYAFHREAPRPTRVHGVADEMAILRARLERFIAESPPLAARVQGVLTRCERLAAEVPAVELTTIHRDFHQDQVLVDGDRLWLLDMDEASQGDPALDVGNFAAHLWEQGVRQLGSAEALQECSADFIESYVALAGEAVRPRIESFALVSFARHISLSSERPERRPFVEAVLQECERRFELGGATSYVSNPPSANS